MELNHFIRPWL